MKKYFLLILIIGILLTNSVFAWPPISPEQEKRANEEVTLCESTGGIANKIYIGGYDPKRGIDLMPGIIVECDCPSGITWNTTTGCVQKQDNTILYLGIITLIVFIFIIIFWKLKKITIM